MDFCITYKNVDVVASERILRRAAKYNVVRAISGGSTDIEPMFPSVFEDIGARAMKHRCDCLAIAANCCDYSI